VLLVPTSGHGVRARLFQHCLVCLCLQHFR
jgi:hypothetical protein